MNHPLHESSAGQHDRGHLSAGQGASKLKRDLTDTLFINTHERAHGRRRYPADGMSRTKICSALPNIFEKINTAADCASHYIPSTITGSCLGYR